MADVPAQLDYAQPPGWRRRTGVRRAVFGAALLLLILGSFKFLGPAWDHVRLLHYQGRCLRHTASPGGIVLTGAAPVVKSDVDWERFYALFSPPGGNHGGVAFLRELRRPDGAARLVAVEADFLRAYAAGGLEGPLPVRFDSTVIQPGGLLSRPHLRSSGSWASPFDVGKTHSLKLHTGQVDPANPAHFTIAFTDGERAGTIDGWLQPDDTILLELRDPLPANN